MIRLSPQLLIAAATSFIDVGELVTVDVAQNVARIVGPWDDDAPPLDCGTELVQHWGFWSHFDHRTDRSTWPMVEARTADEIAEFGRIRNVLRTTPMAGDIYLQFSPVFGRFVRAGVVARVDGKRRLSDG